ncbi:MULTISPECIES: phosphate ABC transporter substrate-binding protein PstS [unclassified Nitratiruptor]|uniref:phosphate ABC transporter substrate-binding protein PstS n=1 Tax=unclassified Nitratiruptor TaxID=2624044 RepID=UPI001916A800|nr:MULTISPECIES: phosphate ABC transporter substrate-binding protein PstS [unclassified Nitratiruptor]BCD59880.1 phosphate transport system substrate-binding protein [Nitratiruptor sp. YY08-10]BCD63803.1 phosphate transport system substrate-binding protein [Nitratiruptor sp. YY08-14]
MLKKAGLIASAAIMLVTAANADKISGAGATFPVPLYYEWAYDYEKLTGVEVNYQSIGSGGGIKQISFRTVDFGASDKPLKPRQLNRKKLYQFPAVIGSIVVVYNIPGIADMQLQLENKDLAEIFLGKITFWDDKKIAEDNPGVKLPHKKIVVVHRSDGSGTTFNFTYFLSGVSEAWANSVGTGKAVDWPVGIGGKGNEGVSNLVKQTPYSIGYVEYAYKLQNHFTAAAIQTKSGKWVQPTEENFKAAAAHAKWGPKNHFYQVLALQPGDNSYPIVAGTFILLPREKSETNKKVTAFFDWAFRNGDETAKKLGYIPLPASTKEKIQSYWKMHGIAPK